MDQLIWTARYRPPRDYDRHHHYCRVIDPGFDNLTRMPHARTGFDDVLEIPLPLLNPHSIRASRRSFSKISSPAIGALRDPPLSGGRYRADLFLRPHTRPLPERDDRFSAPVALQVEDNDPIEAKPPARLKPQRLITKALAHGSESRRCCSW